MSATWEQHLHWLELETTAAKSDVSRERKLVEQANILLLQAEAQHERAKVRLSSLEAEAARCRSAIIDGSKP